MRKLIDNEYNNGRIITYGIMVVVLMIFTSLCINSYDTQITTEIDNLNYLIPAIVLIVVFRNFRYLKDPKESFSALSVPISKMDIFKIKYIVSLKQLLVIILPTIIMAFPIFIFCNGGFAINYMDTVYVSPIYYLSLLVKLLFVFILFNFFVYFFLKGKNIAVGFCYIIIAIALMSLSAFVLMITFDAVYFHNVIDCVFPLNIFNWISQIVNYIVSDVTLGINQLVFFIYSIAFIIITAILVPFIVKKINTFKLENVDNPNKDIFYKIFLVILSTSTIILTSFFIEQYLISMVLSITSHFVLYIMYSLFIERYRPTTKELKYYFIVFFLALFLPHLI